MGARANGFVVPALFEIKRLPSGWAPHAYHATNMHATDMSAELLLPLVVVEHQALFSELVLLEITVNNSCEKTLVILVGIVHTAF